MRSVSVGAKKIGAAHPCFLIAEIGSNHNLNKGVVRKLIDAAYEAGFDAVKFQTYDPKEVFSARITTRDVNLEQLYGFRPWWEVARDRILMPRSWFGEMFAYVRKRKMIPLSTVHSLEDAKFIMQFDPQVFKVASIDVTYLDFLAGLAKFKKPIILSTGMSNIREVREAVSTILKAGNNKLALLHCVSCYPPRPEEVNIKNIELLREEFNLPVGFSDHSLNNYLAIASVALGSSIIEKHITLDRDMRGPDHSFALTPDLMGELVLGVREVEVGLGSKKRKLSLNEAAARAMIRRSIVARCSINKNTRITKEMLKFSRPGTGIEPKFVGRVISKRPRINLKEEEVLTWGKLR